MQNVELVVERRLRPVFESIELGNYKKALQDVEKVLRKNPNLQCGRALKAWAFIRLGRDDESKALIDTLETENPSEATTLQVMTLCYKETEQLEKICSLYSNAAKESPGNEELLSQLFTSHVRINDFKSQQTVALQLYKIKPKNPYYFWAVMSVVLQALRGPDSKDPQKAKLLLALAQRMIDKLITENRLEAAQEIQLYLSILHCQEKHQESLVFLDSELCQRLYPGAPETVRMDLLKKLNKWADLNMLMKKLLKEDPDRWDYYQDYINSTFELIKIDDKTEGADYNVELCHEYLCELMKMDNKKMRGPYLGRLELHRLMVSNNYDKEKLFGEYLDFLVEYFRTFGDKACCANDLKLFLKYLEPHKMPELAAKLLEHSGVTSMKLPGNKEQMQRHICSMQISRFVGAHYSLTPEHLAALFTALTLHYEHGLSAFGMGLLSTDMGPSDPYALLAVQVMYDLSSKLQKSDHIIEALCLLNYLLKNAPSNFHAKLLCLQMYHRLGFVWSAHKTYEALDIKHIQLDSLGYLHCAQLCSSGLPAIAKPLYDQTLNFFISDYQNSIEFLKTAYNFGSFSKLQEFMDFRDRLSNSLHYSLISVEALLLEIVNFSGRLSQNLSAYKMMRVKPHEDRIQWNELSDNRDLSIFVKWDPIIDLNTVKQPGEEGVAEELIMKNEKELEEEVRKESYAQDYELLKLRSHLLRLLSSSIELLTKNNDDDYKTLQSLKNSWGEQFSRNRSLDHKPISNEYLVNLLPSRLHLILRLPYDQLFNNLSEFILDLWKGEAGTKSCADILTNDFNIIFKMISDVISQHNATDDLLWNRKFVQDTIVGCVEMAALALFILTICYEKYSTAPTAQQVKKGKKKEEVDANVVSEKDRLAIVCGLLHTLKVKLTVCEADLDSWKSPILAKSLTVSLEEMSLNPTTKDVVHDSISESHKMFVNEVKKLLKEKLKMINKSI